MANTGTSLDWRIINTTRVLAADTVEKAKSGHPGAPMGCAPMAHVLFTRFMHFNPQNPLWFNRDRFILSNGHGCALQYILLHLFGYAITLDDLKSFRQLDSITPGHPERVPKHSPHYIPGIELTTGPLGQGISSSVGLAIAQQHLAAVYNRPNFNIIDNYTFVICGDGCLQEGVSSEASSLAGHLGLGRLIVLYDDNHITIDGDTEVSFTEDVLKRYESYGWHTQVVANGDGDLDAIQQAVENAKNEKDRPSLIKIRTTIGFGSANQGKEKVHGSALGEKDVEAVKVKFGFNPKENFVVPPEVKEFYKDFKGKGVKLENAWNKLFDDYSKKYRPQAEELARRIAGKLPENWEDVLPRFTADQPAEATRKLSEIVLNKLVPVLPELVGGSADLTGSNLTRWKGAVDFQKPGSLGDYTGRYLRFGVREHGMCAVVNGLAGYGGIIPFGATFLNFISYALGAVRLTALSQWRALYIMTHDSIGLGEDGPTHEPIETVAGLRAMPNLLVLRPADGNEVSGVYRIALENLHRPSVLCLSRQPLMQLPTSSIEKTLFGGYILNEDLKDYQIIIIGTGSETSLAYEAGKILASENIKARIVSMPCCEVFDDQSQAYKEYVLTDNITFSVEAYSTVSWYKYAHIPIGLDRFGASAPYKDIYNRVGLVPSKVAENIKRAIASFPGSPVSRMKYPYLGFRGLKGH